MKQILFIALVVVLTSIGNNSIAQNQQGQPKAGGCQGMEMQKSNCCGIPNLTEEQMKKMEPMKLAFHKQQFDIKNQINVKEAQLVLVTTGDKINKDEAYKLIDEISVLKANMQKAKLDHRLAVRALLTPEQQFFFDQHGMKGDGQCGDKKGHGMNGQQCGQGKMMQGGSCSGQGQMQGGMCCLGGQKPAGGCSGQGQMGGQGTGCTHNK